ncbi:hypothetical protein LguiB_015094 [Lonicera macranthoides]
MITLPSSGAPIILSSRPIILAVITIIECPGYSLYYRNPYGYDYRFFYISTLPPTCCVIQPPVRSDILNLTSDPFQFLTADLLLENHVSGECSRCHFNGGNCSSTNKQQEFQCLELKKQAVLGNPSETCYVFSPTITLTFFNHGNKLKTETECAGDTGGEERTGSGGIFKDSKLPSNISTTLLIDGLIDGLLYARGFVQSRQPIILVITQKYPFCFVDLDSQFPACSNKHSLILIIISADGDRPARSGRGLKKGRNSVDEREVFDILTLIGMRDNGER